MKRFLKPFITLALLMTIHSCQKDFLEKKPDKQQVVPETLDDLQALLDNTSQMNSSWPGTQEVASDNYYLDEKDYEALDEFTTKNGYTWLPDVFNDSEENDWSMPYTVVFYANLVLETLTQMDAAVQSQPQWKQLKGSALFFRAFAFYNLTQLFSKPYDPASAQTDLGIVLRLKSAIHATSVRATVQQSYAQIFADLEEAISLLPDVAPYKTRPSVLAAKALLARIALSMGNYQLATEMADACLKQSSSLLDYNTASKTAIKPFARFNQEVIFHTTLFGQPISLAKIDPELYSRYHADDLRKVLYFKPAAGTGLYSYKGSYHGGATMFGGLATDELYLIRAEGHARSGKTEQALSDLNILMKKRWNNKVVFPAFTAKDADEALDKILAERRKELVFRGLRWSDLRRLNREEKYRKTLTRLISGKTYSLQPFSNAYVFQIPESVIRNNNMPQNPR